MAKEGRKCLLFSGDGEGLPDAAAASLVVPVRGGLLPKPGPTEGSGGGWCHSTVLQCAKPAPSNHHLPLCDDQGRVRPDGVLPATMWQAHVERHSSAATATQPGLVPAPSQRTHARTLNTLVPQVGDEKVGALAPSTRRHTSGVRASCADVHVFQTLERPVLTPSCHPRQGVRRRGVQDHDRAGPHRHPGQQWCAAARAAAHSVPAAAPERVCVRCFGMSRLHFRAPQPLWACCLRLLSWKPAPQPCWPPLHVPLSRIDGSRHPTALPAQPLSSMCRLPASRTCRRSSWSG